MRTIPLGTTGLNVPTIAIGCMRLMGLDKAAAEKHIRFAMEQGANFFDHADIYGGGKCESLFAEAIGMNPAIRQQMILQSKCAIRPGVAFDFSREHIVSSVDNILKRLNTEYLDVLLLHRPDALAEPEEVAEAFDALEAAGKVRHFGVSNHTPMQIQLLKKCVRQPISVNQMQMSLTNATMITAGLHANMEINDAIDRDGGVLDFCRLHDITMQIWSPLQHGFFGGSFIGDPDYAPLNAKIREIGEKYNVSDTTIALAWLLRHPAKLMPVVGTMNPDHLRECLQAADIRLTRDEWYALYLAAGNTLP